MNFRYSAAGFRQDQEELFKRFNKPIPQESEEQPSNEISLRFTRFCELWKEMRFSLIFRIRHNEKDLREFIDEIYLDVLPYVGSEYPLPRRVCALYMLYSLFVKQPKILQNRQQIRLNFQYLEQIRDLIQRCKELGQLDVCFIWYKLLSFGAIDLVHVSRLMGPFYIRNLRFSDEKITETDLMINEFKDSLNPSMDELSHIHEKYRSIKDFLVEDSITDPKVNEVIKNCDKIVDNVFELYKAKGDNLHKEFFSNNLTQKSMTSDLKFDSQEEDEDSEDDNKRITSDIGSKRRKLKEKASAFGSEKFREEVLEQQKQVKKSKPVRGRPKLAKLTEILPKESFFALKSLSSCSESQI